MPLSSCLAAAFSAEADRTGREKVATGIPLALDEVVQSELWRKVMGSSPSWIGLPSLLATAVLDH
jgi:hypothetical protein